MKINVLATLALASTLMAAQCKKAVVKADAAKDAAATSNTEPMLPIYSNHEYRWPGSTDQYNVIAQEVKGDSLILTLQYGGGCKDHVFTMRTTGLWQKTSPPRIQLYLEHVANGDNCRALITKRLAFDLSTVRNPSSSKMKIILNDKTDAMLDYAY